MGVARVKSLAAGVKGSSGERCGLRRGTGAGIVPATMPEADPAILAVLRILRRRVAAQEFMDRVARAGVVIGGLLVALAAGRLAAGGGFRLVNPWEVVAAVVLPSLLAAGWTWRRWPTLTRAAGLLDGRANTRDRFTTALALAGRAPESLSPVEQLARAECARFAGSFDPRPWLAFAPSRSWLLVMVPPLALALLLAGALFRQRSVAPVDPAIQATLHAQADELQKAADTVAGRKEDADRRLAEELARAAERLRQAAALRTPDPEAARRDALRALSDLQNRLKRLAADAGPSPAELAALAAALQREGSEAARAAAEALKQGDGGEASRQLEKLLEEMKKNADPAAAMDRLARAMQEQAGKLSEQERGELGRQMAAAQAEAEKKEELLKKIADLLRQRGANGAAGQPSANQGGSGQAQSGEQLGQGGGSSARGLSNQQLQSLLNSLENMKNGLNGNGGPGQGGMSLALGDGPGRSELPAGGERGKPGEGNGPTAGAPGSEHDPGTSELGNRPVAAAPAPPDRAARASGLLGEGEVLSDLAPSTDPAAPARAGRRYREVYEAMAPAARDSVRQENIPLGSRVLVERYFQNIRPPD